MVAAEFNGGVIIGADSRTSSGTFVANRVSDKLTQVIDTIYCCRSGSSADTQAIADIVKYHLELHSLMYNKPASVLHAATCFKNMCYEYRDSLQAGVIVAGFDDVLGGQIYTVPLGGMVQRQTVSTSGSGSAYIMGFIDEMYDKDMSRDDALTFVTRGKLSMGDAR